MDGAEDRGRVLVVPVVEDRREDVDVARRDALEEAAGDEGATVAQARLVDVRLRQVEDDAAATRVPGEQRDQQRAVAAAHVDDRLVAAPLDLREVVDPTFLPLLHRAVERGALVRVGREPRPELGAEDAREGRLARRLELAGRVVPDAAEEAREVVPAAVAVQQLRRLGVGEDAGRDLGEDPVARKRAQEAVERVGVGAALARDLRDGSRPGGERVRDVKLGDDPERPRRERATQEVPQRRLRVLPHPRARATAAATSSSSSSASVRQSSNSLPSRTIPTAGGSPWRSGAASSSSSAQAKLGTSASGSAPPPTRPTVSSTVPPTSGASRSARARTAAASCRSIRSTGIRPGASR